MAGKTGTAHKASAGGYAKDATPPLRRHRAGHAIRAWSASVVIDDPQQGSYYGGLVSGPVFAKVMDGALRLLDMPPDNIGRWYVGGPMQGAGWADRQQAAAMRRYRRSAGRRGESMSTMHLDHLLLGIADACAALERRSSYPG